MKETWRKFPVEKYGPGDDGFAFVDMSKVAAVASASDIFHYPDGTGPGSWLTFIGGGGIAVCGHPEKVVEQLQVANSS